jgi:hypothetical protein
MKIVYRVQGEDLEFVYFSFTLGSKVIDLHNQLSEDGQNPELLLFKGKEMVDKKATLSFYGFSDKTVNDVYGTSKQTNG